MPYEVIARKFRPQRFHDLVGQDQVSVTLQRAIAAGRVPQALLLIGPRGTGKTSTARIVAKSLRCQNPSQGEPCNQCADCLGITAGQQVDVLEIDGASNNGVDAIRSLRESVAYAPASGRYKIYIIDEVHMLSQSAFNALLKTLEEPPAHVVFIMATTEVHKIPLTILSRCQKYHFRKIPTRQIAEHLKKIATQEGFVFEDEALWWVAKLGQGSMRDAQTLLEQLGNSLDRHLTTAGVREVLGLEVDELVGQFFWLLLERTPEAVSEFFQKWLASSVEPKLFMEELLRRLRATLLVQQDDSPATRDLLDLEETQWQSLKRGAEQVSPGTWHIYFDMAMKGLQDILKTSEPRVVAEVVLLRLLQAPRFLPLEAIHGPRSISPRRHSAPKTMEAHPPLEASSSVAQSNTGKEPSTSRQGLNARGVPSIQSSTQFPAQPSFHPTQWLRFVEHLRAEDPIFAAKVEPLMVHQHGGELWLSYPPSHRFLQADMQQGKGAEKLAQWIQKFWKYPWVIGWKEHIAEGVSALVAKESEAAQEYQKRVQKMLDNPRLQKAKSILQAEVKILGSTEDKK